MSTLTNQPPKASYKPFLISPIPGAELLNGMPAVDESDWTSKLDLGTTIDFSKAMMGNRQLNVLVLYGSLRERSVAPSCRPSSYAQVA